MNLLRCTNRVEASNYCFFKDQSVTSKNSKVNSTREYLRRSANLVDPVSIQKKIFNKASLNFSHQNKKEKRFYAFALK